MCGSTLGEVVVVFPVVYAPGNGRVREVLYLTPRSQQYARRSRLHFCSQLVFSQFSRQIGFGRKNFE